jgi:hypothetical protein
MISSAGYVLMVPQDRREILLAEDFGSWYSTKKCAIRIEREKSRVASTMRR